MSQVWINGRLVDKADAKVSPFDHGFLYGDGAWDHFRIFGGRLFRPDNALGTLFTASHNVPIHIPLSQDQLQAAIEETVRANDRTEGYVRVIVSRGPGTIGPDPRKIDPQVIIIAEEYLPFPLELYDHGLEVVISETGIWSAGIPPIFRLLGQRHIIKAKTDALSHGCLEAVLVDDCYRLYGSTEGNLFRVLDGTVCQLSHYPFEVTSTVVREIAGALGTPFSDTLQEADRSPDPDDLCNSDEVFLSGTSCGVIGIVKIDEHTIGSGREGPITRKLREQYRAVTRGSGG